jgi:hypothetical protein
MAAALPTLTAWLCRPISQGLLAIDKRLQSLFGPVGRGTKKFSADTLRSESLGERKPDVNEKLLRVAHIAAFLTGLLIHDGQKIFWMTDHDSICATSEMHENPACPSVVHGQGA